MRLARVIRTGGIWALINPPSDIDKPPIGTIVQYKWVFNGGYDVYFPGVRGFAWAGNATFHEYFEDIDSETS